MTGFSRVLKNSIALSLSTILERGVAFFLPWYLARTQGTETWGEFVVAQTFVTIAVSISYWGFPQYLPRQIARSQSFLFKYFTNALCISAIISLVVILITTSIVWFLDYPTQLRDLIFLGLFLTVLPNTEALLTEAAIHGVERMEWVPMVRFPCNIGRVLFVLFLLERGFTIKIVFVSLGLFYLAITGLYLILLFKFNPKFITKPSRSSMQNLLVGASPFAVIVIVGQSFRHIDRIFLSKFLDSNSVGFYAVSMMILQMIQMLAPAIMNALFPPLSRLFISSQENFRILSIQLFKILFLAMFPIALTVFTLAEAIIILVFDPEYYPSINVLRIIALSIIPMLSARLLFRVMLASNNENLAINVSIIKFVANICLNLLLIPKFGIIGAALVFVFVEFTGFGFNIFYTTKYIMKFDLYNTLGKPLLCLIFASFSYGLLYNLSLTWAWISSLVTLTVIVLSTKTFSISDWNLLTNIVSVE